MGSWTNRLVVGAAVLAMAPVTARLATPSGGQAEAHAGTQTEKHASARPAVELGAKKTAASVKVKGKATNEDLLDPASAAEIAEADAKREFNKTLCSFLERYGSSKPADAGADRPVAFTLCSDPVDGDVDAMIAILPDPIHTRLALRFDRAVDDLQNTALQLGWLFHQAWLPWGDAQSEDGSLRFQEKAVDAAMLKKRDDQPGLILFRRGTAKRPLVVLVVGDSPTAGVNPEQFNAAVDIWNQLHVGLPVCDTPPCAADQTRRMMILGPTFTGSADSLHALLQSKSIEDATVTKVSVAVSGSRPSKGSSKAGLSRPPAVKGCYKRQPIRTKPVIQCRGQQLSVAIASGTMTSGQKLEELTHRPLSEPCEVAVNPVSFAEDSIYQRSYLLRFLEQRVHKKESQIAELSEEESGFGAQMAATSVQLYASVDTFKRLLQEDLNRAKTEPGVCTDTPVRQQTPCNEIRQKRALSLQKYLDQIPAAKNQSAARNLTIFFDRFQGERGDLQLKFPRGISLLRKAYAQSGILGFGGGNANTPRTELELNMQDDSRDDDAVAQLAGSQSAASMESRMAQLAATLQQKRVAVVVLSATDVLDDIFVAKYLQTHAPGVTVVIQDADVLFLRNGTDSSMEGVYVVSPYPLIPQNVGWSHDMKDPLHSTPTLPPSQGDQGTENAVRYLLCGGETNFSLSGSCEWQPRDQFDGSYLWMKEYEPPLVSATGSYSNFQMQPPLWLSVIGHGGFQPISLIDVDQEDANFPGSSAYNLPRLGRIFKSADDSGKRVWIHPEGINGMPMLQMYVCALILGLLLCVHGWAVCRCRLDRPLFWSYAAADAAPWTLRLLAQAGIGFLGIYALSLLLLHDQPGLQLERPLFKAAVVGMQVAVALVNGVAAWRITATPKRRGRKHWRAIASRARSRGLTSRGQRWGLRVRFGQARPYPDLQIPLTVTALAISLLFVVVADSLLWRIISPSANNYSERAFFFLRCAYPLNGASPLLPVLLLLGAVALWSKGRLGKLVFYSCRIPLLPINGTEVRCPCGDWTQDLESLLGRPIWSGRAKPLINWFKVSIAGGSMVLVCMVAGLSGQWGPHSLEYTRFDTMVDLLSLGIATAVVHNLAVALFSWRMLKHEVLSPLKQSPLRWGFTWIKGFSWKRLWTSPEGFSPEAQLEYVIRNVEAGRRGGAATLGPAAPTSMAVQDAYDQLLKQYGSLDLQLNGRPAKGGKPAMPRTVWRQRAGLTAGWAQGVAGRLRGLYFALAKECDAKLTTLKMDWAKDYGPISGDSEVRGLHNGEDPLDISSAKEKRSLLQRQADEEFVAMVYLTYIRSVLVQIRDRVGTAAGLYILLLWALTGYPWMNRHGILLQLSALLGLLAVVAILIYSEMQKDDILSRTTETTPGKLDGEFFTKILSVVGIPALTLVASQFPEFSSLIFSWLEPGLSTMR